MKGEAFYAGTAKLDITPPKGTILGVDFFNTYARYIHDPLYVRSLAIKSSTNTFVFVVADACIFPTDLVEEIKLMIFKLTGLAPEQIMISTTHTHGAPNVSGLLLGSVDISYRSKIPGLIAKSVVLSLAQMKPAKMGSGMVNVPAHQFCRRYFMKNGYIPFNPVLKGDDKVKTNPFGVEHLIEGPAGPVDPGVGFLAVKGEDDSWIALLANYSTHYAADWDVDSVTADFYGEFANQIQEKLQAGEGFTGMMTYGTGADVNTIDFQNPNHYPKEEYAKSKIIAGDLTEAIVKEIHGIEWIKNPSISFLYEELPLPIRKPTAEELEMADELIRNNRFNNLKIDEKGMKVLYAREQFLLNEYPDKCRFSVQAIKIGNLIIGALGGEFFSETGLFLKKNIRGINYFSICLANNYCGYVPPAHEIENGGYETWRARSSFLNGDAESEIRKKMLELVSKL